MLISVPRWRGTRLPLTFTSNALTPKADMLCTGLSPTKVVLLRAPAEAAEIEFTRKRLNTAPTIPALTLPASSNSYPPNVTSFKHEEPSTENTFRLSRIVSPGVHAARILGPSFAQSPSSMIWDLSKIYF
jgi:hypothetical protein